MNSSMPQLQSGNSSVEIAVGAEKWQDSFSTADVMNNLIAAAIWVVIVFVFLTLGKVLWKKFSLWLEIERYKGTESDHGPPDGYAPEPDEANPLKESLEGSVKDKLTRKPLPSPYLMSSRDVVDRLNCRYRIKEILRKALSVWPNERYDRMKDFVGDLDQALAPDAQRVPVLSVVRQELYKLFEVILHSILGVLVVMVIARSALSLSELVHLSDRAWVAAFHGSSGVLYGGF